MSGDTITPGTTPAAAPAGTEAPPVTASGNAAGGAQPAGGAPPAAAPADKPGEKPAEKTPEAIAAEKKTADEAAAAKAAEEKAAAEKKAADEKVAKEAAEKKAAEEKKSAEDKAWAAWKPSVIPGVVRDDAQVKRFVETARTAGLSPEKAQPFLDLHDSLQTAANDARLAQMKATEQQWLEGLQRDAGSKEAFDAQNRAANKAFEHFADEPTRRWLGATGLDKHPGLFKAFAKIGQAMANDSIAGGMPGDRAAPITREQAVRSLYPSMFPKS